MKGRYGPAYAHKRQKRNTTKKSRKKAIVASDGNRRRKRIQDKNDLEVTTTNSNTTTKSTRNTDTIFYGTKVTDITPEEMIAGEKGKTINDRMNKRQRAVWCNNQAVAHGNGWTVDEVKINVRNYCEGRDCKYI